MILQHLVIKYAKKHMYLIVRYFREMFMADKMSGVRK